MARDGVEADSCSPKVVSFPLRAARKARKPDVERINQFEFFDLGEKLQDLKSLASREDLLADDALFPFWIAHGSH